MAKRRSKKSSGGRGSAEAIEKRRVARQLNTLLLEGTPSGKLDGRTEKRRKRLIKELKEGRGGSPLKPIDFVSHVDELLSIGESVSSLRRAGVKPRKTEMTPDVETIVERTQAAYNFRPEAWKLLGVQVGEPKKRGRPRGRRTTKG